MYETKNGGGRGKIVGSFVVEKVVDSNYIYKMFSNVSYIYGNYEFSKSCASLEQLKQYGDGKDLYAIYISQLKVFEKELREFYVYKNKTIYSGLDCPPYVDEVKYNIKKAPQSKMWAYMEETI
jgi:hypothetical protein